MSGDTRPVRATEQLDIAAPKKDSRRLAEGDLRHRHQDELADGLCRALGFGVERLDALDGVAEEIDEWIEMAQNAQHLRARRLRYQLAVRERDHETSQALSVAGMPRPLSP